MGVRVDTSELNRNLERLQRESETALKMYCNETAKAMEGYAKRNRPWTDRTTRARQSLNGYVESSADMIRVCIAHGVWYGINLETKHEKRYAILLPTVKQYSSVFMKGLHIIWRRIRL